MNYEKSLQYFQFWFIGTINQTTELKGQYTEKSISTLKQFFAWLKTNS